MTFISKVKNSITNTGKSIKSAIFNMENFDQVNLMTNLITLMYSLFRYYFATNRERPPAAVLAGIPLGSVDELSHAISNRILKYRATGGVFLAHQGGGEQSLRITAKAFGKNRYQLLTMIDFLFLYGQAQKVDMLQEDLRRMGLFGGTSGTNALEKLKFETYGNVREADIVDLQDELPEPTTNPWQEFYEASIDSGMSERHLTFPIITQERVYLNMFIETWEYTEAVENGIDVLEINLFLRKYVPEARKEFIVVQERHEIEVEEEEEEEETQEEVGPIQYYFRNEDDRRVKDFIRFDTALDWGLSTSILAYRWFILSKGDVSSSYGIAQMFASYSKNETPVYKLPKSKNMKEELMEIKGE